MSRTQRDLESEVTRIQNSSIFNPEKTVEEVYGRQEDWIIEIGKYRLMLLPFNQQWWWYDQIHESWEYTGYNAGEVTFTIKNGKLVPPRKRSFRTEEPALPEKPVAKVPVTAGGEMPGTGRKFCSNCGKPLKTELKFCVNCGAKIG